MKGRCVKCGGDITLEKSQIKGKNVIWVFKCNQCTRFEGMEKTHDCDSCGKKKDVQFIMVRNSKSPQVNKKEYYCPEHLRARAFQLEIMKLSNMVRKKLGGWW